jgi:hypothetical protein
MYKTRVYYDLSVTNYYKIIGIYAWPLDTNNLGVI